jgi:hypothetical protein
MIGALCHTIASLLGDGQRDRDVTLVVRMADAMAIVFRY